VTRDETPSPLLTAVAGAVVIVLAVRAVLTGRARRARRQSRIWRAADAQD
jgi:heme exporter protein D